MKNVRQTLTSATSLKMKVNEFQVSLVGKDFIIKDCKSRQCFETTSQFTTKPIRDMSDVFSSYFTSQP